jgi:hypothetical protein
MRNGNIANCVVDKKGTLQKLKILKISLVSLSLSLKKMECQLFRRTIGQ